MTRKRWVNELLEKKPAIEKAIGMPMGEMLGCGHWGCAFASSDGWVVKLSIDPTEGPIWSKSAGLVEDEVWGQDGFARVKSLHRITPDLTVGGRKRKVWAIVREGIEPVFEETKLGLLTTATTNDLLGYPQPVSVPTSAVKQRNRDQEDFARMLNGLIRYRWLSTLWHTYTGQRESTKRYGERMAMFQHLALSPHVTRDDVEDNIERVVSNRFNGGKFAPLGESLHMLATHKIFLRDVHFLNIGWRLPRRADEWAHVVIFDPGHTPTDKADIETVLIENPREAI